MHTSGGFFRSCSLVKVCEPPSSQGRVGAFPRCCALSPKRKGARREVRSEGLPSVVSGLQTLLLALTCTLFC